MLPTLQIKSTEGCISLLPCDTGEATAAVAIFLVCVTQRIYLQEEYCSKVKMNSQYMRHEVRGCETSDLRNFWEKTIEQQTQYLQNEKERQRRSALTKWVLCVQKAYLSLHCNYFSLKSNTNTLRNEWMERLEKRIKMLRTQSEDSSS
ncbi:hypothetical protein RLOC_00003149 [Lonchura striata]|uniref:Uncharacterized protein n=1 Tax=Lonchura striata TaxID=40157 RepID=A0A218UKF0_9PASE|nr:hypothetical protein RLOC_00003149 [Lonchura striata domestica]